MVYFVRNSIVNFIRKNSDMLLFDNMRIDEVLSIEYSNLRTISDYAKKILEE